MTWSDRGLGTWENEHCDVVRVARGADAGPDRVCLEVFPYGVQMRPRLVYGFPADGREFPLAARVALSDWLTKFHESFDREMRERRGWEE